MVCTFSETDTKETVTLIATIDATLNQSHPKEYLFTK